MLVLVVFALLGAVSAAVIDPCDFACTKQPDDIVICGTDDVTYDNVCFFGEARCRAVEAKTALPGIAHIGKCDATTPVTLAADPCDFGCTKHRDDIVICGTDAVTYDNVCFFAETRCRAEAAGSAVPGIDHIGKCDAPAALKTDVCDFNCAQRNSFCGTDGVTYNSLCRFSEGRCRAKEAGGNLGIAHPGVCPKPAPAFLAKKDLCDFNCVKRNSFCGTDGVTYNNLCSYAEGRCRAEEEGKTVGIAHTGECVKAPAAFKKDPCDWPCTKDYFPLCGKDGKTYENPCIFAQAQCRVEAKGGSLEIAKVGEC